MPNVDGWRDSALQRGLNVAPRAFVALFEEDDLEGALTAVQIHLEPQLIDRLDAIARAETDRLRELAAKHGKTAPRRVARKEVIARLLKNAVDAYERVTPDPKRGGKK